MVGRFSLRGVVVGVVVVNKGTAVRNDAGDVVTKNLDVGREGGRNKAKPESSSLSPRPCDGQSCPTRSMDYYGAMPKRVSNLFLSRTGLEIEMHPIRLSDTGLTVEFHLINIHVLSISSKWPLVS